MLAVADKIRRVEGLESLALALAVVAAAVAVAAVAAAGTAVALLSAALDLLGMNILRGNLRGSARKFAAFSGSRYKAANLLGVSKLRGLAATVRGTAMCGRLV